MLSLENGSQENHHNNNNKSEHSAKQAASVKKILPSVPDAGSSLSTSLKMIDRPVSAPMRSNTTYGPFFLEYSLMAEYVLLQKQRLPGVYVVPSASSALKWFGVIFVRHGLYQGGVFRFTLYIPNNYPECDCPILVFEPSPFHPLVNFETGELDLKRAFPKWRRNVNHLWQVLLYARRIFYNLETEAPSNQEAADLYEKDRELFKQRVLQSINACNEKLYDKPSTDDPHAICFEPWDPAVHEDVRQRLLSVNKKEEDQSEKKSGLSWVQQGTLQIFSKPAS